jgi:hypothetical protein
MAARANGRWPMKKDMPARPGVKHATGCPVRAWESAMGRPASTAKRVDGPLMPADQVGRVLMALGRRTLPGMDV